MVNNSHTKFANTNSIVYWGSGTSKFIIRIGSKSEGITFDPEIILNHRFPFLLDTEDNLFVLHNLVNYN